MLAYVLQAWKILQQDDVEAERSGLISGNATCDCCVSAEAGMVVLVLLPLAAVCQALWVAQCSLPSAAGAGSSAGWVIGHQSDSFRLGLLLPVEF